MCMGLNLDGLQRRLRVIEKQQMLGDVVLAEWAFSELCGDILFFLMQRMRQEEQLLRQLAVPAAAEMLRRHAEAHGEIGAELYRLIAGEAWEGLAPRLLALRALLEKTLPEHEQLWDGDLTAWFPANSDMTSGMTNC